MYRKQVVFVYGTLKRGCPNHFFLDQARLLGVARTVERYALYEDEYPRLYKGEQVSRIQGEVYEIDEETLARLDRLEDHPHSYRREEALVELGPGRTLSAWIYFSPSGRGRHIPQGVWPCGQE
jgi:gamma-glutamylaminecyclotransferase